MSRFDFWRGEGGVLGHGEGDGLEKIWVSQCCDFQVLLLLSLLLSYRLKLGLVETLLGINIIFKYNSTSLTL